MFGKSEIIVPIIYPLRLFSIIIHVAFVRVLYAIHQQIAYLYLWPTTLYTSWIRSYFTYLNPEFPHRAHFHTRYWTEVIFRYYGTFCSASNSCHSLQERTTRPLFNITCIILLNSKHHNVAFISIKNPILTPITPDINNGAFDGF